MTSAKLPSGRAGSRCDCTNQRVTSHLSRAELPLLPSGVQIPEYDLAAVSVGAVHFGPGAFHRVHQANYFDDLLHHVTGHALRARTSRRVVMVFGRVEVSCLMTLRAKRVACRSKSRTVRLVTI